MSNVLKSMALGICPCILLDLLFNLAKRPNIRRILVIVDLSPSAVERSSRLMEKYADLPMDLADATLVAYAEEQGLRAVFTLDSDFAVYRINGRVAFRLIPTT